jgi:hypoxanthine-DNA glycosylase
MMITSFAPIVNSETKILILGTIPGITSLAKQEYYGHPRNHFWTILFRLLDTMPIPDAFEEKVKTLQNHKIGLWDVLKNCKRQGSLDIHIKKPVENDFEGLLKQCPSINRIVFNGKESHRYFFKKFGQIQGITYFVMPSTSPANTMPLEKKFEIWAQFLA